jgi:hypothetical protein
MALLLEDTPVVFQTLIGHAGSTVLQSLFDGHPEVAMFPGVLSFYCLFHDDSGLVQRWKPELSKALHHQFQHGSASKGLGQNGDERASDISAELLERTVALLKPQAFSRKRLFFALHQAMAEIMGQDLGKIRYVWCHEHDAFGLFTKGVPAATADKLNFRLLVNVRDPRSNWISVERLTLKEIAAGVGSDAHLQSRNNLFSKCVQQLAFALRALDGLDCPVDILRLEDLQRFRFHTGKVVATRLGLSIDPALERTTFWGKRWTGHWFSKAESGIANTALLENWAPDFKGLYAASVERALRNEIQGLGYSFPIVKNGLPRWLFIPWVLRETSEITHLRTQSKSTITARICAIVREWVEVLRHTIRMIRHAIRNQKYYQLLPRVLKLDSAATEN